MRGLEAVTNAETSLLLLTPVKAEKRYPPLMSHLFVDEKIDDFRRASDDPSFRQHEMRRRFHRPEDMDPEGQHPHRFNFTLLPDLSPLDESKGREADGNANSTSMFTQSVTIGNLSESCRHSLPPIPSILLNTPSEDGGEPLFSSGEVLFCVQDDAVLGGKAAQRKEPVWVSTCMLASSSVLRFSGHCVRLCDIDRVVAPPELGAFVFQVGMHGAEVFTFRAASLSQLMDCCEGLWSLLAPIKRCVSASWTGEMTAFHFPS